MGVDDARSNGQVMVEQKATSGREALSRESLPRWESTMKMVEARSSAQISGTFGLLIVVRIVHAERGSMGGHAPHRPVKILSDYLDVTRIEKARIPWLPRAALTVGALTGGAR